MAAPDMIEVLRTLLRVRASRDLEMPDIMLNITSSLFITACILFAYRLTTILWLPLYPVLWVP